MAVCRVNAFGTGHIQIAEKRAAITVPSEAVQRVLKDAADKGRSAGVEHLVFVRRKDGLTFEPRTVRLGVQGDQATEIVSGVRAGEVVVTAGSHVLRSELFRSEIGGDD